MIDKPIPRRVGRTGRRTAPRQRERDEVHRPLVARLRLAKIMFCHVPNESMANIAGRVLLRDMGLLPGMPDLLIFDPPTLRETWPFRGVAIELKAPGQEPTPTQYAVLGALESRGWLCSWHDSVHSVVVWLQTWGYAIPELDDGR